MPWLGGCDEPVSLLLTDVEGRRFRVTCPKDSPCTVEPVSKTARDPFELRVTGRLVGICGPQLESSRRRAASCRPLACRAHRDCPPVHGIDDGACLEGLCSDPANAFTKDDAVMLCLAETKSRRSADEQAERYALAVNCGDPCVVPAVCRKP